MQQKALQINKKINNKKRDKPDKFTHTLKTCVFLKSECEKMKLLACLIIEKRVGTTYKTFFF